MAVSASTAFDGEALSAGLEFVRRAFVPSAFWIRRLVPELAFAGDQHRREPVRGVEYKGHRAAQPPLYCDDETGAAGGDDSRRSETHRTAARLLTAVRRTWLPAHSKAAQEVFQSGVRKLYARRLPSRLAEEIAIRMIKTFPLRVLRDPNIWNAVADILHEEVRVLREQWNLSLTDICEFLLLASAEELEDVFNQTPAILSFEEIRRCIAENINSDPLTAVREHARTVASLPSYVNDPPVAQPAKGRLDSSVADEIVSHFREISDDDWSRLVNALSGLDPATAASFVKIYRTEKDPISTICKHAEREKEKIALYGRAKEIERHLRNRFPDDKLSSLLFMFAYQASTSDNQILTAEALGGHLKTGHRWTLQNRPTEQSQDKSSYTVPAMIPANFFGD